MNTLSTYIIIKKCFVFQAGIGISANTFLLFFHLLMLFQNDRSKFTDLITCHLSLFHILMLLTAVAFLSPDMFESLNFQNDLKCKAIFYINIVMRGLSICTTCFLCVFQAITISPSTSGLLKFKHKLRNNITGIFFLFWFLNLSFSSYIIIYTVAYSNVTQTSLLNVSNYCSLSPMNSIIKRVFFILTTSRDVFFVGVMLLSSAYMVILLFRHKRRSQRLHSTSLFPRTSPEKRATQTILLLVSCFVVTYWVDLIIISSSIMLWTHDPVLMIVQKLVLNVYATVCSFVQIGSDKRIINILKIC
ncbi:putative vomeronasal receptor-like protein 4, partial [Cynocephalus volans]|uniref:putative vomeronasal receptor-like protein 4 n=1 Tax=Cynocephalus volans TaxID=110931 RepID=UPI002FC88211